MYLYRAGSNDIFLATTPAAQLQNKINGALASIDTALRQLDARGAKKIVVAAGCINWDAAHKTTRVHELMAAQLLTQVPAPSAVSLLAVALLALALTSRGARAAR